MNKESFIESHLDFIREIVSDEWIQSIEDNVNIMSMLDQKSNEEQQSTNIKLSSPSDSNSSLPSPSDSIPFLPSIRKLIESDNKKCFKILSECCEKKMKNGTTIDFIQLKVCRQRTYATCGYHAYFNAIFCMKSISHLYQHLLNIKDQQQNHHALHYDRQDYTHALDCLSTLCNNSAAFWFFFNKVQQKLIDHAKYLSGLNTGSDQYPWDVKYIKEGCMERSYMSYLIRADPVLQSLNYDIMQKLGLPNGKTASDMSNSKGIEDSISPIDNLFTSLPELNKSALESCIYQKSTIERIQEKFETLHPIVSNLTTMPHAFLIGCGNHWFTLVVNKLSNQHYEMIYMDSRNNPLLGIPEDGLRLQVEKRLQQTRERSNFTRYSKEDEQQRYIAQYLNSLKESQYSLNLIAKCVSGNLSFINECVELSILALIESHHKHVESQTNLIPNQWKDLMKSRDMTNVIKKLNHLFHWFENYVPPPTICMVLKLLEQFGTDYLSSNVSSLFWGWIENELNYIHHALTISTNTSLDAEDKSILPHNSEMVTSFEYHSTEVFKSGKMVQIIRYSEVLRTAKHIMDSSK